jgi:hypothetical protein
VITGTCSAVGSLENVFASFLHSQYLSLDAMQIGPAAGPQSIIIHCACVHAYYLPQTDLSSGQFQTFQFFNLY